MSGAVKRKGTVKTMSGNKRIVFLDYLRVFACLMVMFVHACEQYYFGADGGLRFESAGDAFWATWIDSACRAAVPLFVIASSYLLFPLTKPTGEFFKRRFVRVVIPFAIWCGVYVWRFDGKPTDCIFNFPMATGGHLWFVPMLLGLYLLMPLLSPWAEKASEKEVRGWLLVWLFTTAFPFLRKLWACFFAAGTDPATGMYWAHTFGTGDFASIPFLWGECAWNGFGTFHYVSGFIGYLLLGLYFRKFVPELSWKRTLVWAMPLWIVGYAIVGAFFYFRIPGNGTFPVSGPYASAVDLEMSWEFCSTGVALTVIGYFLVLRKFVADGWLYAKAIRPLSEASYGTYLMHIIVLVFLAEHLKGSVPTPLAIVLIAVGSFAVSSVAGIVIRKIPFVGKWIVG